MVPLSTCMGWVSCNGAQGLAIFGDMPGMIATRLNMRLANLGSVNIVRTPKHIKNKIKKERTKNPRRVDAVIINQVSIVSTCKC